MTGNNRRGQKGRWTAGDQFVNRAPTRTGSAFYGGATPPETDARTDGGQNGSDPRLDAANALEDAAEILRQGGNIADAKQLVDQSWHDMTDAEDREEVTP